MALLGAPLRGHTATQHSKKGSEKVLGRVLGKGSQKSSSRRRGPAINFTVKKGSEKGSREGGFQKVPRTPPRRVRTLSVRPRIEGFGEHSAKRDLTQ